MNSIIESPYFSEGVFFFALLLILGGFKIGVQGMME